MSGIDIAIKVSGFERQIKVSGIDIMTSLLLI